MIPAELCNLTWLLRTEVVFTGTALLGITFCHPGALCRNKSRNLKSFAFVRERSKTIATCCGAIEALYASGSLNRVRYTHQISTRFSLSVSITWFYSLWKAALTIMVFACLDRACHEKGRAREYVLCSKLDDSMHIRGSGLRLSCPVGGSNVQHVTLAVSVFRI